MLNKQSSQEKLHNAGSILYSNKNSIQQRYKSHLRGADVPQGMLRNASKPSLQLPEIHSSAIRNQQAEIHSRNDLGVLNSNRSKKSLGSHLPSPHGYSNRRDHYDLR